MVQKFMINNSYINKIPRTTIQFVQDILFFCKKEFYRVYSILKLQCLNHPKPLFPKGTPHA